ncbi:PREDICTED: protein SMG9-like [Amphimedon queenslandica]|uniref:Protein SMG9 n=1 Tax=Amphimedon queenslandica TaxID=400682 RepID=A0A1X7UYE1_AMPQE|nr:PREDICTED: protein SMG9-like [Amphimedon queenslandica]|eukprot:XP_003386367.1 PREDICTED: protein SMG9-like [Amphimedon queenslandica]
MELGRGGDGGRGGPVMLATRGGGGGGGGDRGDRGRQRPNTRRRGPTGDSRPRPQYNNRPRGDYTVQGPMRILTKPNDRHPVMPGSVSIMQRDSSSTGGSETPSSPHIQSPELNPPPGGIIQPPSGHPSHFSSTNHFGSSMNHEGGGGIKKPMSRRPPDGVSSSPSNYTPLQPSGRPGRLDRDAVGGMGTGFNRVESAGFLSTVPNDTVTVKLADKSLCWEDRGSEYLMDQSDFLVVGSLGRQGVGKSTIMSMLAGTRTGSGRPYLFKTQPKDVQESGGYTTAGIDMAVTSERILLLDTQPILSNALLEDHKSEGIVPASLSPDSYLDVLSLQMAIFLFTVCHVVIITMESGDVDVIFRFLWTAEKLKSTCCKSPDQQDMSDGATPEYFPQLVFVLNHATPDDYQPAALKELHSLLAENFFGAKVTIAGGMSLARSGLVPVGKLIPPEHKDWSGTVKPGAPQEECNINLHLLPTNINPQDNFGSHCVKRTDREDAGLNPILSLIRPMYQGHPSFQLLAETLRNQIFMMPRPSLRPSHGSTIAQQPQPPQPMFERDWYDYARRSLAAIKKSNVAHEHKKLLRDLQLQQQR